MSFEEDAIIDESDYLAHYGILRKSGRYPWEGADTPAGRSDNFLSMVQRLRKEGMHDNDIARAFEMNSAQFRENISIANSEKKKADIERASELKRQGLSNVEVGKEMGRGESSIRALLKEGEAEKAALLGNTVDMLRSEIADKKYIDVGKGVEYHLAVPRKKLDAAVAVLKDEGYTIHYTQVAQLGTGLNTSLKVLAAPGVTGKEVYANRDSISQPFAYSDGDGGYTKNLPPLKVDPKRVKVKYAEEGGAEADGVIYVRRGVDDISLGKSRYAQVRIMVDGKGEGDRYLKGMAMYHDDLPPGVDLVFNTNKSDTGNKLDAMKKITSDQPNDPFGAMFRQIQEGPVGNKRVTSAMNLVNEQGDWEKWSKSLSSQMLSKQPRTLIKEQLDLARESKQREFDEIMKIPNSVLRAHLLGKFADSADSSAVNLKAAHMPRQGTHVILPIKSMKENEVYAPNYEDGERVVLIRFPHGGKFEIPELIVNNRHGEAKKLLGQAPDAIGIHSKVAERLSGADFDGDTVLVIPNNQGKVKTEAPLEGLKNFDPMQYKVPEGSPIPKMTPQQKGTQMGKVTNLITDMTLIGAPHAELERAARHSMVVIDAEKHHLDWQRSAVENGISALYKKYQPQSRGGGAATLISRATSRAEVNERKKRPQSEGGFVDPVTGRKVYVDTGNTYSDGTHKKIKSTKLAETDDAFTLSSGTAKEKLYAEHSNALKEMANKARLEMIRDGDFTYSPTAAKAYAPEVKSLTASLNLALRNAPLERQAQVLANATFRLKKQANPGMDKADIKKTKAKALEEARVRVGAEKFPVKISEREWAAIQAGAITKNKLKEILNHTNLDVLKELATPRETKALSSADKSRAISMLRAGYNQGAIAKQLGVSVSTIRAMLGEVTS